MRKIIVTTIAALLLAGGATAAFAGPENGKAGPNGSNNHGLCTAYFNGSETGRAHKHDAGPFQALEVAADDGDGETSPEQDVWTWCNDAENNSKGIGGNPTDPNS